ncbi:MAG: DUF3343 domain-containing protein [Oscillospiraceae bacterium]|nr:DUF3343 domain-containing protein [Oscillospiraceae bacterium]
MYDLYLTLRSVTPGQKGREALRRAGISCELLRAPRAIAPEGCAYALALRSRDRDRALEVLERAALRPEGLWLRGGAGSFERSGL